MKQLLYVCVFLCAFAGLLAAQYTGTYYNSISPSSPTFVSDLKTRVRTPYTHVTYANYKTTLIPNYESRDTTGGRKAITCIYSGLNYVYAEPFAWIGTAGVNSDSGFSREHTWCHNWMPTNPADSPERDEYADQHHLFPANQNQVNAIRSDHPLGNVTTVQSTYLQSKLGTNSSGQLVFEPRSSHKGDAARALFYMCVRYDGINGYTWNFDSLSIRMVSTGEAAQSLTTLLAWHAQDPPDKWEIQRNTYVESVQGNRNPFVDHPEFVSYINFANLSLLAPTVSTEPANQPTALSVSANSSTSITLNWTNAAAGSQSPSGYLIEIFAADNYFVPMDGVVYSDDLVLSDGVGLINQTNSGSTSATVTGLSSSTTYYVRMFSYNGTGSTINYKISGTPATASGSTFSGTVPVEPSNYPTNFNQGTITTNSIQLTWTKSAGPNLPTGYLLYGSSTTSYPTPTDGTVYTDDAALSDGSAVVNLDSSVTSYTFTGLTQATNYYFKIVPFAGSGSQRDYKTSGTAPTQYGVTLGSSGTAPVVVNEYYNAATKADEWIELLVLQNNLDMRGMKVRDYSSGGSAQLSYIVFSSDNAWASVARGTIIVILGNGSTATEVTTFAAKSVILKCTNSKYFTSGTNSFDIAGSADAIELIDTTGTHVYLMGHNTSNWTTTTLPDPKASVTLGGSLPSGSVIRFVNITSANDFTLSSKLQSSTSSSPGLPNDLAESTFVATVLPVEVKEINAVTVGLTIHYKWETASEVNNAGFEIFRRRESQIGSGWERVGFVEGFGTANAPHLYTFTDHVPVYGTYRYRVYQLDRDGASELIDERTVRLAASANMHPSIETYPNPCNPTTTFEVRLPSDEQVRLAVYDLLGREAAVLIDGPLAAGTHTARFDATSLASGLYLYRLTTSSNQITKKFVVLK